MTPAPERVGRSIPNTSFLGVSAAPGRTKGHGGSPSRGMTGGRGGVRIARIPSNTQEHLHVTTSPRPHGRARGRRLAGADLHGGRRAGATAPHRRQRRRGGAARRRPRHTHVVRLRGRHGLRRHRARRARSSADGPHDRRQRLGQEGPRHGPGRVRPRVAQRPALRVVRRQDHELSRLERHAVHRLADRASCELAARGLQRPRVRPRRPALHGRRPEPEVRPHHAIPRGTRTPSSRCAPPAPT